MNSGWHLIVSIFKSAVRILGCISAIVTREVYILAVFFLLAEVLGILEELGDNR